MSLKTITHYYLNGLNRAKQGMVTKLGNFWTWGTPKIAVVSVRGPVSIYSKHIWTFIFCTNTVRKGLDIQYYDLIFFLK